jgi:muramoyltetrapeptide carboxypeptidase
MTLSIRSGQTIGIFSPSSSIIRERFDVGVTLLKQRGFNLVIHPQTYVGADTGNQQSSSSEQKASAFMELWNDKSVHAIMASCGGNTASQFLHLLDFKKLAESPKPLLGFSDITAPLSALYARAGIGGYFAPTVQTIPRIAHQSKLFEILEGTPDTSIALEDAVIVKEGKTDPSPIFAATLSVLNSLAGTPYFPNLMGHILVLEDIGEELSHLDRALWQLYQIIPLPLLSGLIFGEFVDIKDSGRPFGLDFDGIIDKYTSHLTIPILKNAPFGHGINLLPIPIGRKSVMDATNRALILL